MTCSSAARKQRVWSVTDSSRAPMISTSLLAAVTRRDEVQVAGDVSASELAGSALPARLDVQEAGEGAGDVDHARRVVVDDEAGRTHAAADGGHPLVGDGRIEVIRR